MSSETPSTDEVRSYLMELRDSGEVNMWGAAPFLVARFGMTHQQARRELVAWIESFNEPEQKER